MGVAVGLTFYRSVNIHYSLNQQHCDDRGCKNLDDWATLFTVVLLSQLLGMRKAR